MKTLRPVLDAARIGTWDWDMVTDCHEWSETQEAIFGFAPGTFPGTLAAFLDRVHPDDREVLLRAGEATGFHQTFHIEFRIVLPGGATRWVSSTGRLFTDGGDTPIRAEGVAIDVTERREAQEEALHRAERAAGELWASQARLEALFDYSPVAILEGDLSDVKRRVEALKAEGVTDVAGFLRSHRDALVDCASRVRILAANEATVTLFGKPRHELSTDPASYFTSASLDAFADQIGALASGRRQWAGVVPVRLPGGESRTFAVDLAVVPGDEDSWRRVIANLSDISERLAVENLNRIRHHLVVALAGTSDLDEGLKYCLDAALDAAGLDAGGIYLLDERTQSLELRVRRGHSETFCEMVRRLDWKCPQAALIAAMRPFYGLLGPGDASESTRRLRGEGLRAVGVIPIGHDGKAIGCLNVASRTADEILPKAREILESIAAEASQAVARMKAEAALKEGLLLRRETERIAGVGGWVASPDNDYLYWTEGVYEILGAPLAYKPGLAEGLQFYDAEAIARLRADLEQALRLGTAFAREVRFTTMSGARRWADVRGLRRLEQNGQAYVMGTFQDITDRKLAEDQIRLQKDLLEETGRTARVGGFWFDPATGEGNWTDEVARIHDVAPGTPTSRDIGLGFYVGDSRSKIEEAITACVERQVPYDLLLEIESATGTRKWVRTIGHPEIRDGRVVRVRGAVQEVTAQKQLEEARAQAEAQLRQAQKMEAIGRLAGGIAHDFNNVLAIITGYAEMARHQAGIVEPQEALLEILAAANRAKDLVSQILTFSRRGDQDVKPVQICVVVEEAMRMLRATIPSTVQIRANVASRAVVMANPTQIHQVLMNLCSNAAQAMHENGGVLGVELTDVAVANAPRPRGFDLGPGSYVRLTVSDTGHGIDPSIQERIFEPFFTTKEKGVGTGLGLAVVHGIVRSHGGTVTLASAPGRGAAFTVYLPIVESRADEAAIPVEPLPRGTERVLVVDDEERLARNLVRLLASLGYEAEYRTNGREALAAIRRDAASRPFALVITDMTMPGLTGAQLAIEILRAETHPRVLMCTGYSETMNPEKAKALGIDRFIMKPYTSQVIATVVRQTLDGVGE